MSKKNIDLTTVGGRIKAKRLEAGLTQEQLADRLYMKFTMISRYERSECNMTIDTLKQIAAALGCSASYLLEGVETQMSEEEQEVLKVFNALDEKIKPLALSQMKLLLYIKNN